MAGLLTDKVAFITGAARGQGRAHAVRMANEGTDIIAVDIAGPLPPKVPYDSATADDFAETVDLVKATGRRIFHRVVDVRDYEGLRSAVADGVTELGRLFLRALAMVFDAYLEREKPVAQRFSQTV